MGSHKRRRGHIYRGLQQNGAPYLGRSQFLHFAGQDQLFQETPPAGKGSPQTIRSVVEAIFIFGTQGSSGRWNLEGFFLGQGKMKPSRTYLFFHRILLSKYHDFDGQLSYRGDLGKPGFLRMYLIRTASKASSKEVVNGRR